MTYVGMDFSYLSLNDVTSDVRLLKIVPGTQDDPIQIVLWHTPLVEPPRSPVTQQDKIGESDVTDALPPGWVAVKTPEGRWLFEHETTEISSWNHPNPNFDSARLELVTELPHDELYPHYEALSYVWGSDDTPYVAHVQTTSLPDGTAVFDDGNWRSLKIGTNLRVALQHLRLPEQSRTLWIDAICINQRDEAEKAAQVTRMSTIYRRAERVIIWLGPKSDHPSSSLALSTLGYLGQQVELSRGMVRFAAPDAREREWFRAICTLPYTDEVWASIHSLLGRPYFQRLWIVQEVLLAKTSTIVACGHDQVHWYHFLRAIVCLVTKDSLSPSIRRRLDTVRVLTWNYRDFSIPFVLNLVRTRQCYNQSDKIYGVLGITPPSFTALIKPDYTGRVSAATVYQEAFLAHMRLDNRATLLQDCELTQGGVTNLPSWVPNWSIQRDTHPLSAFVSASGISRAAFDHIPEHNALRVLGRRFAVIESVSAPAPRDPSDVLKSFQNWEPPGLLKDRYVTGGSLLDAYLVTLRVGYLHERWPNISADTLADWRRRYLGKFHSLKDATKDEQVLLGEVYWATTLTRGRCFVTTKEGFIGLAPGSATPGKCIAVDGIILAASLVIANLLGPGDIACAFLGCKSAMLLRGSTRRGFQVVGECYVHGMDDGVGLLGLLPVGCRVQLTKDSSGHAQSSYLYYSGKETKTSLDDPRLGPVPYPWQRVDVDRPRGGPALWACFRNQETGELIDSDPRLLPDALETMGVPLESFELI